MQQQTRTSGAPASALTLTLAASLALSACGPSAELQQENERLNMRVADLEKANKRLEREADDLHAKARKLQEAVDRLERREALFAADIDPSAPLTAHLHTTKGTITCALWPEKAPLTVANFVQLAEGTKAWTDPRTKAEVRTPLYDGTIFHRVIPEFMIQGGDPLGTGSGGPGYRFQDEVSSGVTFDRPNLLAMANSGPDTNGSQFFITDRSQPSHLDGKHTIFGVCEDADVVRTIAEVERNPRDRPLEDVVLQTVDIVRG